MTNIKFPCDFQVKVMGKNSAEFLNQVLMIVHKYFPTCGNGNIQKRYSQFTNYMSISITVYAENKEQLDELYRALTSHPDVLMAL